MKYLIILISILYFHSPVLGQNAPSLAPPPPPPPPPRTRAAATQWDSDLIKKQRLEIQKLKAEVELLKAERKKAKKTKQTHESVALPLPTETNTPVTQQLPVAQPVAKPVVLKKITPVKNHSVAKKNGKSKKSIPKKKSIQRHSKKVRKPTSVAKNFKSGMHRFKKDCTMFSKPNGKSSKAGSVSAGKKLWVDSHNANWRKAYKKSGTVFVHKSCF